MRRAIMLLCGLFVMAGVCHAEMKARLGGGYGWLLTPDLDEYQDIPTVDITRGGGSINFQLLLGRAFGMENYRYGVEVSFLRSYRYEYHVPVTTEITLNSFPVLLISQYDFSDGGMFTPFLQGGVGVAHNQLITETGPDTGTDTSNDLAVMAGPGMSVRLSERLSLDFLVQYYLMFTEDEYTRRVNVSAAVGLSL